MKKILIIIGSFYLIAIALNYFYFTPNTEKRILSFDYSSKVDSSNTFNLIIDTIKFHEGFSDSIYLCPAGKKTIGYGHRILKTDTTKIVNKYTADKILRDDFIKAIRAVERNSTLRGNKLLAISHFVFCFGIGNYGKSTLKKLINKGFKIDNEIKKWSNINGRINKNLINQRNFELSIYNGK